MLQNHHDAFDPSDEFDASEVKTVAIAVREDGPDAFGQKVKIPPKSYYRRPHTSWLYNDSAHDHYEWITLVGSKLFVLTKDGCCIQYEGCDIDGE